MNTRATNWKLYTTNEEGWGAMLEACESATISIDLEQFIFVTDDIGKKFIEVCARKAQQGVKVRFLWDAAGSFSFFGSSIVDDLKKKGIELVFFKTLFPNFLSAHDYKSWYFRNHRRTLVIDTRMAFTGSICVSDKMINWRDTMVRIEGPVVNDMQKAFERMWDRAHGKKVPKIDEDKHSDREFKYITNNPLPRRRRLYKHILDAIHHAQKYIYITTPYFVPTRQIIRALRLASHRGVDVKIILPEWTDHPLVDLCARTFFSKLLESGVRVYFYRDEMLHSKTVVIDGGWATVGTLNFDNVSLLYNFEANLVSTNKEFTAEVYQHFIEDVSKSEEVTLTSWKRRYWVEKFAGFFIRFVRDFL
jgi:cardiolipin synthase